MSTRKRVKSVTVDQILSQIKQMTKNENSIYEKLSSYDKVLRKYKIDSLNQIALEIYEYLIEEQTVSTLPQKSRVKVNALKFSRSEIQIVQDQSLKNNEHIQDPETYNQKLFSFAKNNNMHDIKRILNQDQLQPRQLFMEPNNKFKSDKKATNYPSRLQRDLQNNFGQSVNEKSLRNSKSKSAKDLIRYADIQSQRNVTSKSVIFNSQKTKSIEKVQQQMNEMKLLEHFLKRKYFATFIQKLKVNRQQAHFKAIVIKTKYIYCKKLFKKSFQALKQNHLVQLGINERIEQINSIRNQSLIEEIFLEWRAYSKLNQEQKQRIQMIDSNFQRLCNYLFINKLKSTAHMIRIQKQEKQRFRNELQKKSQTLLKKIFYQRICSKFLIQKETQQKINQIQVHLRENSQRDFIQKARHYYLLQKQKESNRMNKCITKIYGKRMIKNLINQQNFMQVYWKRKDQSQKIIFLNYLLTALKHNFGRLGFQYPWMRTLEMNVKNTDVKLGNTLSKYQKSQVFKRLVANCIEQKQKRHKIKIMLMDSFLRRLTYSNYINFKKQSEENKTNEVQQFLFVRNGKYFLQRLTKTQEKQFVQKQIKLKSFLYESKSQQFFIYLESYKRTKNHYSQILSQYQQRRTANFISLIWNGFKKILKEQIINKKLVLEYLKLKDKIMRQNCFQELKNNVFQEKIFRKKQQNLNKLIKRKNFDSLITKLKENLKYEPFNKKQIQFKFKQSLLKKRKISFFQVWRNTLKQDILANSIQQRLVQNYQFHLLTKCFKIMKFVTVKTKQQYEIFEEIRSKNQIKRKYQVFEKLLQVAVKKQSLKHLIKKMQKAEQNIIFELLSSSYNLISQKSKKKRFLHEKQ